MKRYCPCFYFIFYLLQFVAHFDVNYFVFFASFEQWSWVCVCQYRVGSVLIFRSNSQVSSFNLLSIFGGSITRASVEIGYFTKYSRFWGDLTTRWETGQYSAWGFLSFWQIQLFHVFWSGFLLWSGISLWRKILMFAEFFFFRTSESEATSVLVTSHG